MNKSLVATLFIFSLLCGQSIQADFSFLDDLLDKYLEKFEKKVTLLLMN